MKILHINASTRGLDSQSLAIANYFLNQLKQIQQVEIDTINLFEADIPAFDGVLVGAKMALFTGQDATEEQTRAWKKAKAVFDRFAEADAYVFNIPLWNNGIPYILKQYIDVVTQPGWTFGFDLEKGYSGLLNNKKALVVHASGVYYPGIPNGFGEDFSTPYIESWLKLIGISDINQIQVAPSVVNPDFGKTKKAAEELAQSFANQWAI